jgi:hypothetical protein
MAPRSGITSAAETIVQAAALRTVGEADPFALHAVNARTEAIATIIANFREPTGTDSIGVANPARRLKGNQAERGFVKW